MKVFALLVLYLVWGTTYLGVKIGLESLPPFLLIGLRLILAGALLYTWRRIQGKHVPSRTQWAQGASVGFLILVCGLGVVVWSVQTVPSGLAALLVSTMPVWLVLMEARAERKRLRPKVLVGLFCGLVGVALLLGGVGEVVQHGPPPIWGMLAILAAAISWAAGSLRARSVKLCADEPMNCGMQMLTAGLVLSSFGLLSGEGIVLQAVSLRSGLAFVYLTLFGSLLAFSTYLWLLKNCSPSLVSTYAYVNPVVALLAGYFWGGEPIGPDSILASFVILVGVGLMMTGSRKENQTRTIRQIGSSSEDLNLLSTHKENAHGQICPTHHTQSQRRLPSHQAPLIRRSPFEPDFGGQSTGR